MKIAPVKNKYLIALPCFHGDKGFNHQTILVSAINTAEAIKIVRQYHPKAHIGDIKIVNY